MIKRTLVTLLLLVGFVGVIEAQVPEPNFSGLERRLQSSNKEIENPKKNVKGKTWIKRAELMQDIAKTLHYNAYTGMEQQMFNLVCGLPTAQRQEMVNGSAYMVYQKPRTDFYFTGGKLAFTNVTKPIIDKPLMQAYAAYQKAIELDTNGKLAKKIKKSLEDLRNLLVNEGVNAYAQEKFVEASEVFTLASDIAEMPQLQLVDTVLFYYTGLSYYQTKEYERAAQYFEKCIDNQYYLDGVLFCSYYETMHAAKKTEDGYAMLKKGVELFPEQQCLMMDMIQYYILQGEDPSQVLPYIDKALVKDPNNAVLYFVKGVVYNQLKDPDNSLKSYQKAVEIKPDFIDAWYNQAALYYNEGVNYLNEAMEQPVNKMDVYDALMQKADSCIHACIEPANAVLKVDPAHIESLDLLKTVYFRYRTEPGMQAKYDDIVKRIEEVKGN